MSIDIHEITEDEARTILPHLQLKDFPREEWTFTNNTPLEDITDMINLRNSWSILGWEYAGHVVHQETDKYVCLFQNSTGIRRWHALPIKGLQNLATIVQARNTEAQAALADQHQPVAGRSGGDTGGDTGPNFADRHYG